jgi:predicted naringenin-chalcone synthase
MLRNVLDKSVPCLVVEQARDVLARGLAAMQLEKRAIANWVLHAGGRDVLAALRSGLELSEAEVAQSLAVLREFANVSSASVILTLERALAAGAPRGIWWMSAFGAGISCHGAFLEG